LNSKDKFITPGQYAQANGLSVGKVTQMLRDGLLPGEKVGGRWRIFADPAPGSSQPPVAAAPSPDPAPSQRFTVPAFSGMTYLTEQGVKTWLKSGRLKGGVNEAGQWYVDAASLELPDVRRLLRKS